MKTPPSTVVTSEQEAIEALRRELDVLEAERAGRVAERDALSAEIDDFSRRYCQRLGNLHAQLESIREQTQRVFAARSLAPMASNVPGAGPASADAAGAAGVASPTDEQAGAAGDSFGADRLKHAYREAARLVHPDRAHDESDRRLRDALMAGINAAYTAGDTGAIMDIVSRYRERMEPPAAVGRTETLRRVEQAVRRERERIASLVRTVGELRASPWLKAKADIESVGDDTGFARLAALYEARIHDEQARLEVLVAAARGEEAPAAPRPRAKPGPAVAAHMVAMAGLIHGTRRGEMVACASEVLIANDLHELGIDYKYRYPLSADEEAPLPAFTVFDAGLRPIVWDHRPYSSAPGARDVWHARLAWYRDHGFREGANLFLTEDATPGQVDAGELRAVAEHLRVLMDILGATGHAGVTHAYKSVVFP